MPKVLLNTPDIELWPGGLLRARSNHDARVLSRAMRVLRRKRDGRFLAAELPEGLMPLVPSLQREDGIGEALDALDSFSPHQRWGLERVYDLPLARLHEHLDQLGIEEDDYAERTGLSLVAEPDRLDFAGFDRFRRPMWLRPGAARAWLHLQAEALRDDVVLESISGYRIARLPTRHLRTEAGARADGRRDPHRQCRARFQRTPRWARARYRHAG